MEIKVNKVDIKFDLQKILEDLDRLYHDDILEDAGTDNTEDCPYYMSKSEFEESKVEFSEEVKLLTEKKLINLISDGVKFTKGGQVAMNCRNIILSSDITQHYDNHYGSHSYTVPALAVVRTGDREAEVHFLESKIQDSF